MVEGQQAATRHRHTGSLILLLVGDTERKLQSIQSPEDVQPPRGHGHLKCPQTVEAELENLYLSVRRASRWISAVTCPPFRLLGLIKHLC